MTLSINSNLNAQSAHLNAETASSRLAQSYKRLSTGLRINDASDDAAGLAISTSLNANVRILSKAAQNVSDGQSVLAIADGALQTLTNILQRVNDLAEQASSSLPTQAQRTAMDTEASALVTEYNAIIQSTQFNSTKVLDGSLNNGFKIQAGSGAVNSVGLAVGANLAVASSLGTFTASGYSQPVGASGQHVIATGDFNNDGITDVVVGTRNPGAGVSFYLGNSDGTFRPTATPDSGITVFGISTGDLFGDGKASESLISTATGIEIINGTSAISFTLNVGSAAAFGDVTGDGAQDLVVSSGNTFETYAGNNTGGAGLHQVGGNQSTPGSVSTLATADLDGDGKADVVAIAGGVLAVYKSLGGGSYSNTFLASGSGPLTLADVNGDGKTDILTNVGGNASVLLGNGNGTFNAAVSFTSGAATTFAVGDINGDGITDILTDSGLFYGQSSGGYGSGQSAGTANVILDANRDGVLDTVGINLGGGLDSITVNRQNTASSNYIAPVNLLTVASAQSALTTVNTALTRLQTERGAVGASSERLGFVYDSVTSLRLNDQNAAATITDVDVASETAQMTREQILQQYAVAVEAQAQQDPRLILKLLAPP